MTTIDTPPDGYPPEIIGYAEPWIVSPGDTVAIKISSTEPEYKYRAYRVVQGVNVEHGPKYAEDPVTEIPTGTGKGRFQLARPGSYALIEKWSPASVEGPTIPGLDISFPMQPWLVKSDHVQALFSTLDAAHKTGVAAVINMDGQLELWVGTGDDVEVVPTGYEYANKRWVKLQIAVQGIDISVSSEPVSLFAEGGPEAFHGQFQLKKPASLSVAGPLTLAASYVDSATASQCFPRATNFFNGRLEGPTILAMGPEPTTLARFDFSQEIPSDYVVDVSGNGLRGALVNAPMRAVKGHDWDGTQPDWTKASYGYGAIHFHQGDMDDAAWETDFTVTIPATARSGAYAVEVESTGPNKTSDAVTFFVRPSPAAWNQREGKVAFVLSTFTYLAYANEGLWDLSRRPHVDYPPEFGVTEKDILLTEDFARIRRRPDLGWSLYDYHHDGSGVVHSSSKRPIMNIGPGYMNWLFKRPREFSADSMFIGFLEREGIPYEIITDHDLHEKGAAAINGFNTVMTGCHPEYPTLRSYQAFINYAQQGGNLMYLGGNGFYWVSAVDLESRPHRVEVRRGDQGVRAYCLPGGERVHSIDGEQGSLWRSRGLACNVLWGVGFASEGLKLGVPFRRSEASLEDPSVAWIFEGIPAGDLIGVDGLGGGASGDEIDRFDLDNGSPANTKVLATSTGHSDAFVLVPEDAPFPISNTFGSQTDLIRSDITYYKAASGGGVFSVGSINWFCSLGWDDYDNNVARMTGNVIHGFLKGLR